MSRISQQLSAKTAVDERQLINDLRKRNMTTAVIISVTWHFRTHFRIVGISQTTLKQCYTVISTDAEHASSSSDDR